MTNIRVKFFAQLREQIGVEQILVERQTVTTLAELITQLQQQYPDCSVLFQQNLMAAINQEMVTDKECQLSDDDEVALFPPVTGG